MSKQVFLSHANHSSKLIKPKEVILGRPHYSQSEVQVTTYACNWCLKWMEGGLLGLSPLPVESDSVSG